MQVPCKIVRKLQMPIIDKPEVLVKSPENNYTNCGICVA